MMTILDTKLCLRFTVFAALLAQLVTELRGQDAKAYVDRGMLSEAEAEARKEAAAQPDSADVHYLLGYILFRETKARESLAEYTEAARHRTPQASDLRVVGADYVLLTDYGDADKWFTKATELDPANLLGWYYLGRAKYNENRFEEAVSAFKHCLQLSPKDVRAADNLGLSLQGLGRNEDALAAFHDAIEWQADLPVKDPWPSLDLGSFLLENNHPDQAVPYLRNAIALDSSLPKPHQQLGKAYLALKDFSKAQPELEEAARLEPESAPAHYILGQLYQKQGQAEKAKAEFARYAQLSSRASK